MKRRSSKNPKPRTYGNIASAIIPTASLIAFPSASDFFPRQKTNGSEQWDVIASALLRASLTSEQLVPSARTESHSGDDDDDDSDGDSFYHQKTKRGTSKGQMDASSDEDDSDGETTDGKGSRKVVVTSSTSRSASITETEKRLFGHEGPDEKSVTTTADPGLSSTIHLDAKPAAAPTSARSATATTTSTTSTTSDDKNRKKVTVTVTRQYVPPLVLNPTASASGPAVSQASTRADTIDEDGKSLGNTTARSSVNDSTTAPTTARSVSFKEPVVYQMYEPSSSKSQPTTSPTTVKPKTTAIDRLVMDLPDEYQQKLQELQQQNQFLNDQVQRLQAVSRKQQEDVHDRLQGSQKLSQTEIVDLLKQSGQDQIKGMQEAYESSQERCRQLQMELASLKERHAQDMEKSNVDQLKSQNRTLEEHNRRLNAALSEYQAMYPSETLKKTMKKDERKIEGLPTKGPIPIWMLDRKFLAPLFVFYDQKLQEKNDYIQTIQSQLFELENQVRSIMNENASPYRRQSQASPAPIPSTSVHTLDLERVKQQAYLVLEENKVLHEHLDLQTNRLTDMQKTQNQEVSNLTRRLMIVEKEKTDAVRTVDTIRMRNEELRTKYDQLVVANDHRIHVDEHMREMDELKRIIDELSGKHASEMQLLLRRVQEAEGARKLAQSKLSEYRNDMERLRGEIKATTKYNRKLQIRVQTFEKKLELQQIKEQHTTAIVDQTNEALEKTKFEQEAHASIVKAKEDEIREMQDQFKLEAKRFAELERRLESSKSQGKDRVQEMQDHMKKQIDTLQLRCTDYDQRLQQLSTLLTEKQILIDDLNSEKRNLEVGLEHIWLTTNADNKRMHEQLRDMRVVS